MKNRALAVAIALSGLIHLIWMSTISVVIVPEKIKVSRFAKISFLNPSISTRVIEVRMPGAERAFLEKRFAEHLWRAASAPSARSENEFAKDFFVIRGERMTRILLDAIGGGKSVPPPSFQE